MSAVLQSLATRVRLVHVEVMKTMCKALLTAWLGMRSGGLVMTFVNILIFEVVVRLKHP